MASKKHPGPLLDPSIQLSIFDNMADGVCVTTDGTIQFMNRYLIDNFGDGIGKPFCEFFPRQYDEKCEDYRNKTLMQSQVSRHEWYSPKTRQTFDVLNSPFQNQKGSVSILSLFRDVTEQKRLQKRLEGYYTKLKESNTELKRVNKKISSANQKLEELSIRDELTGLYNHRHFWDILSVEFKRATRYENHLSCLIIDIDLFKSVNDLGTHSFGDYCLSEVGRMIRSTLRAMDVAARYGGEEFTVILPSTDYAGAKIISEKIREKIQSRLFKKDGLAMNITVSIGISSLPEDKVDNYHRLVEFADQALYGAKMHGRNRVCLYRDLRLKDREAKLGREKVTEMGFKLFNIMEGVKRDYIEATKNLIQSVELKEKYRQNHSLHVSRVAARIAESLELSQENIDSITYAALLHDLGRLAINPAVLSKKGRLSTEEFELVKEHPVLGAELIKPIRYLQEEFHCILHHHEWYNGSGYPQGLMGEEIPLGARILTVADAYDAMKSARPYRQALSKDEIKHEFLAYAGIQFDPNLTPLMLHILEEESYVQA